MSAAYQLPTAADIRDALGWISPDVPRDEWVRILMSIKATLGDGGRDIAEEWSAQADRYNPRDFRDTWRSIKEGGGITAATLFRLARDAGWQSDAKAPPRPPERPQERVQESPPTLDYARAIWQRVHRADAYVASHPYAIRKGITHAAGAGRVTVSGRVIGRDADCSLFRFGRSTASLSASSASMPRDRNRRSAQGRVSPGQRRGPITAAIGV